LRPVTIHTARRLYSRSPLRLYSTPAYTRRQASPSAVLAAIPTLHPTTPAHKARASAAAHMPPRAPLPLSIPTVRHCIPTAGQARHLPRTYPHTHSHTHVHVHPTRLACTCTFACSSAGPSTCSRIVCCITARTSRASRFQTRCARSARASRRSPRFHCDASAHAARATHRGVERRWPRATIITSPR